MFPHTILLLFLCLLFLVSRSFASDDLGSETDFPTVDFDRLHAVPTGNYNGFSHICGKRDAGKCENTVGSYLCVCNSGFELIKNMCYDVDECMNTSICGKEEFGRCENVPGTYKCICNSGFELINNMCYDVDECKNTSICGKEEFGRCVNVPGTYKCNCNSGFELIGNICYDVDECKNTGICGKEAFGRCENRPGTYKCNCISGFELQNGTCSDVDECGINKEICGFGGTCVNSIGSFSCNCINGYYFTDGKCSDIDECLMENICGTVNVKCENTLGSYKCFCNHNDVNFKLSKGSNGTCARPCEGQFRLFCSPRGTCKCYLLIKQLLDRHEDVRLVCYEFLALPLMIRSDEVQNFIAGYLAEWGPQNFPLHVGAYRRPDFGFLWYDGRQMVYTNWREGEPNNSGGNKDCMELLPLNNNEWSACNCGNAVYPGCQKPV